MNIKINIDENKLLFINVPSEYSNFIIKNYGFAGCYLSEINDNWQVKLPYKGFEILGFVKDVVLDEINVKENFVLRIL